MAKAFPLPFASIAFLRVFALEIRKSLYVTLTA